MIEFLRERWSVIVITLGAIAGVWSFWTLPALESWREAEGRRQSAELELAALEERSPADGAAANEAERLLALRFAGEGVSAAQDRTHQLAEESGASIVRLSASAQTDGTTVGPVRVVRESLTIEVVGDFDSLARFLSAVRETPMAAIESFSITPPSEGDSARLQATVRTLRLEEARRMIADGGVE